MLFDVAILGGGTAGATAALQLARAGRSVAVLERQPGPPPFKIGEALPPTARPLLARLGLLEALSRDPHRPACANRSAWGSPALRGQDFLFSRHGLGWHLDRPELDATLLRLAREAGAAVFQPFRMTSCRRRDGLWRIGGREQRIAARLAVDASGRAAVLGRRLGAGREVHDRLLAVYCLFAARPEDEDETALVESFAEGWWYTARLPGQLRIAMLMTDKDTPAARSAKRTAGFLAQLARTVHAGPRVGDLAPLGPPAATGANSSRLRPLYGEAWLAVGDAALSFDPLSSQGISTALYCADKAASALGAVLDGDPGALPAYAALLDQIFSGYLQGHRLAYQAETRWADRPFWRRRSPGLSGTSLSSLSAAQPDGGLP